MALDKYVFMIFFLFVKQQTDTDMCDPEYKKAVKPNVANTNSLNNYIPCLQKTAQTR